MEGNRSKSGRRRSSIINLGHNMWLMRSRRRRKETKCVRVKMRRRRRKDLLIGVNVAATIMEERVIGKSICLAS